MTASQAEKLSALVSEVSLQLAELTSISKQLANKQENAVELLNNYRDVIRRISITIEQTEYSGLFDLAAILQDGLTSLIEQNRTPSHDELYFLIKLPDKLLDYISYPTSKLPGMVLLRLFKHQGWIRPISDEEEQILTEFMLPQEDAEDDLLEVTDNVEHVGLDLESSRSHASTGTESVSLSDFIPQEDDPDKLPDKPELSDLDLHDNNDAEELLVEFSYDDVSSDGMLVDLDDNNITVGDESLLVDLDAPKNLQLDDENIISIELDELDDTGLIINDLDEPVEISEQIDSTYLNISESDDLAADEKSVDEDATQNEQKNAFDASESADDSLTEEIVTDHDESVEMSEQIDSAYLNFSESDDLAADEKSVDEDATQNEQKNAFDASESADDSLTEEIVTDHDESVEMSEQIDSTYINFSESDVLAADEISVDEDAAQNEQNVVIEASEFSIDSLNEEAVADIEIAEEISLGDFFGTDENHKEPPDDAAEPVDMHDIPQAVENSDGDIDNESESDAIEHGKQSQFAQSVDTIELDESVLQEIDNTPLTETDELAEEYTVEQSSADAGLNDNQQELVDLVRAELAEIIDERDELRNVLTQAQDIETQTHHLMNLSEQAENISNAVRLIGLEGMGECANQISENIRLLAEHQTTLTADQMQLMHDWPVYMLGVLQNIYANEPAEKLVNFLSNTQWQQPLSSDRRKQVLESLQNPDFVEEVVEQRQQVAEAEDVTLQLSEEVNMELLEGLLQDLPAQTEEFSASIQGLAEAGGISQLEVAQRIAHTLKGAANVVGVKGIANLTHHLEDILQVLTKAGKRPSAELQDVLMVAADCLEAMSETLLGVDVAPDNAQQVLQDVLDWANRLDKEGLRDEYTEAFDTGRGAQKKQATDIQQGAKESESISTENVLRIPTRLADDMLRLAGENLISNVQVQTRIKNTMDRQEALKLHNLSLQELSSDLEHLIDIQGITSSLNVSDEDEFDPLELDQYHELHSVSRRLIEITADSIQHANVLEQELLDLKNLIIAQNLLHKENQELVLRTRMVPIKTITPRVKRGVRQACRLTGKKVDLVVMDNDTSMDSEVLNGLIEPLMHLLRNAVDHGIESPEERQQLNKPETGQIQLDFTRQGEQIVISVRDDGRGLDTEQIRMQAVEKQLITSDHEIQNEEINRLILEPGFTTRQGVTHVSGRGIGLDVVNVKIRDLKGSIAIKSILGKGCSFELTLPISSFSTHSLLIRVREFLYAISSRGIVEILYPGAGEISDVGDETVYQLGDQTYRTLLIDSVLGLPHDRRRIERQSRPVILVQEETGAKTAIMVQEVISSIDVVVKPMGHYLPKVKGIVGATVLGDGSVAPVIDLPEMLFESTYRQSNENVEEEAGLLAARLPYVLVVDDSLSARRSLAQFIEDLGLEVRTARDGMEAVSLIEVRKPDLILVDMEMPKMNGLELTSHIRASDSIKNLPIIMITSRSTEKHRKTAEQKGVNHFMVKPFAEDELAGHIHSLLEAG